MAAWDVVEQAGCGYVIAGLLGHILRLVGELRRSQLLDERDASLVLLLGCCSSPGFVIGCVTSDVLFAIFLFI